MKMVKPAIYRFPCNAWGWSNLGDVAQIVGQSPRATWENFFDISDKHPITSGKSIVVVVEEEPVELDRDCYVLPRLYGDSRDRRAPGYITLGKAFVPAGWMESVIQAHERGIVSVRLVRHRHTPERDSAGCGPLCNLSQDVGYSWGQLVRLTSCREFSPDGRFAIAPVGYDAKGQVVVTK